MRKTTLLCVAFAAAVSVNAQSLKPEAGDFGMEIGLRPFAQDAAVSLIDDGLKMRYFLTDADVLRMQIGFNRQQVSESSIGKKTSYGKFDVLLGYERHKSISDRVDAFAGAQIGWQKNFAAIDKGGEKYINRDWNGHHGENYFVCGLMTGIDIYLWKGLYCGPEIGLQWNHAKACALKADDGSGIMTFDTPSASVTTSGIGFYAEPSIRLGWVF